MNWADLHFLRPYWFIALLPAVLFLWQLYAKRKQKNFWQDKVDPHLLAHLLIGGMKKSSSSGLWLLTLVWLLAIIALAGPVWEKRLSPVFHSQNNLVIVLDLSRSMNANDMIPSRLEHVKIPLQKYLTVAKEDRIGLVVFAEHAFIASPLSKDFATARDIIKYANTKMIPVQGSRPDTGILKAIELLQQDDKPGQILLVTDGPGEDKARLSQTIKKAQEKNYPVSILAVGSATGGLIPMNPGRVRNEKSKHENHFLTHAGKPVIAKVNETLLRTMAKLGGGLYNQLDKHNNEPRTLVPARISKSHHSNNPPATKAPQWKEFAPFLLFILIPVSSLAFRRGWVGVVFILFFSYGFIGQGVSQASAANTNAVQLSKSTDRNQLYYLKTIWNDLWIRADYQAYQLFKQNRMQAAAEKFNDHLWQGNSWYRMGEFKKAEKAYAKVDTAMGHFNRGNALAQQGLIEAAIAAYSITLGYDMNFKDASINRKLLKDYLAEKQKQNEAKKPPSQNKNSGPRQGRPSKNIAGGADKNAENSALEKQQTKQQEKKGEKDHPGEKKKDSKQGKTTDRPAQDPETNQASKAEASDAKALSVELVKEIKQSSTIGPDQWLHMIKDNPAELLQLKFHAQYLKSDEKIPASKQPW